MEFSRLFHVQRTIRASSIPQSFEKVPLLRCHPIDAFYAPTCEFADRCTRAPNMLDPQSAHTYESICSQFIPATPARRDGPVLVYDVELSDGATFVINGCHK